MPLRDIGDTVDPENFCQDNFITLLAGFRISSF
jgi:hypothetical protein